MKMLLKRASAMLVAAALLVSPVSVSAEQEHAAVRTEMTDLVAQMDTAVTRGEFVMLINDAFELELPDGAAENFPDVEEDYPLADDLKIAKYYGYMNGDENGNVNPDDYLSGAEAAVVINNLLGFDGSLVEQVALDIPEWAVSSASVLLDLEMMSAEAIEREQLTVGDAIDFVNAYYIASMFDGTPYALVQTSPQEDYYTYTNRQFLATAEVLEGYMYASSFDGANELVDQRLEEMLNSMISAGGAKGSVEWKVKELYDMYMDNDARTASLSEVQPYLDEIRKVTSIEELSALMDKYIATFTLQPYYAVQVYSDAAVDATKWSVILTSAGYGLGAVDYYADDASLADIQQAYIDYTKARLAYIGETENLDERAQAFFAFEQQRAAVEMPAEQANSSEVVYTPITWDEALELTATTGSLESVRDFYNLGDMNVYCGDPAYVEFVEGLYTEENLEVLKDAAMLSLVSNVSSMLGDDWITLSEPLQVALYGSSTSTPLEQRARSFTSSVMSRTMSNVYADEYVTAEVKEDVTELIETIRGKLRERLAAVEWMSAGTKAKAMEKLDSIDAYVAYPDEPLQEIDFKLTAASDGGSLIDAYFNIQEANVEETKVLLEGSAQMDMWKSVPTYTINAFYNPSTNSIMIPAGILQEPFYSVDASWESNLGGIGAIIGHELTHAFDNNGALYDKNGTLVSWWTDADYEAFAELTDKVAAEVSKIEFTDGVYVNGALTTGETIADIGGLASALDAAGDVDGADLSKVMEAWSSVWAMRMSTELSNYLVYADVHAPGKVRVNYVLAQMEQFYETYDVTKGDGMYIAPENRIKIW